MTGYLVPAGCSKIESTEKHSRFIGRIWPVNTEEEALIHIRETRELHWDATHNVYAYIIRDGSIMRYSDDGEPGGTAGIPVLNVFRGENIQNFCCVVTRYFGGVKLGTGGLARAYSGSARAALDSAGISMMALWKTMDIRCAYSQYEKIMRLLEESGGLLENTSYGAEVSIAALIPELESDVFNKRLLDLTAGTVSAEITGESFRAVRIK
jgi:uncharacterized YigZ family protein